MSLVLQSSGGGQITIQEPATASNFTQTLPAASGTVVLAGTTPTFNGITFPATQVPSADANTLDDYEEGTWTPTLPNGGTITTAGSTVASYTKIGRQVTVSAFVSVSSIPNNANPFFIGGLPFTSPALSVFAYGAGSISYSELAVTSDLGGPLIENNNTMIYFHFLSGGNFSQVTNANVVSKSLGRFIFSLTYFV